MKIKEITPKEFEKYLQEFTGRDLTEYYYITDRIIVFEAGKKYQTDESTVRGKKLPRYESEYELWIWGDWKYEKDGKIIETSDPIPNEGGPNFRRRIRIFSESINPKKVTEIKVSKDGKSAEIYLDIGGKFIVTPTRDMFISYSNRSFDSNGEFVTARHARIDKKTGVLIYIEAHSSDKK